MTQTATQQLTAEVLTWPGTSVRFGSRGEYGFWAGDRELGHLHGDRVAHFFFADRRLGQELRDSGQVGPHPVNRHSPKLAARDIAGPADVEAVRELLRLNYDRHTADPEAEVRALVAALDEAQFDADAFAALLRDDAVIVNIAGVRVEGREAIRSAVGAALGTALRDVRTRAEIVGVAFPADGVAVVSAIKHVEHGGAALPARGTYSIVTIREPEGWRVALLHTTPAGLNS